MVVNFNENYHFQGSRGGPTFSRGKGGNIFQVGGGSNCLFPIETHITCDFPGGVQTTCPPPPDPHLEHQQSQESRKTIEINTPQNHQNQEEHQSLHNNNGVARTLKSYADQRETTGSNSDSLQLRPL